MKLQMNLGRHKFQFGSALEKSDVRYRWAGKDDNSNLRIRGSRIELFLIVINYDHLESGDLDLKLQTSYGSSSRPFLTQSSEFKVHKYKFTVSDCKYWQSTKIRSQVMSVVLFKVSNQVSGAPSWTDRKGTIIQSNWTPKEMQRLWYAGLS